MHWLASVTGDRFLASKFAAEDHAYKRACAKFYKPFSKGFRDPVAEASDGPEFIGSGGSIPAWAYRKLGIPGFDAEHYNDESGQICRFDKTTLVYLRSYHERYYRAVKNVLEVYSA